MAVDPDTPIDDRTDEPRGPLRALLDVRRDERAAVAWSILFGFFVLSSYYMLRPVREAIGSSSPDDLHKLWTGTFFAMLIAAPIYAALASRWTRSTLIAVVYRFFAVNMLVFFAIVTFGPIEWRLGIEYTFYIWLSVFNLFVIAAFWSFMADVFRNEQAKRLFGLIAFGGSLGAIAGSAAATQVPQFVPAFTAKFPHFAPQFTMLLFGALLLEAAVWMMYLLNSTAAFQSNNCESQSPFAQVSKDSRGTGGNALTGIGVVFRSPYLIGICIYLSFYTLTASFLYFQQAHVVKVVVPDQTDQTALYAKVNLTVNIAVLFMQLLLTGRIVRFIGVGWTLTILPILCALGFLFLGFVMGQGGFEQGGTSTATVLAVVIAFDILRRLTNYALAKPAREVLFTVVTREQKYKSKGFIDTVVYRGGDAASAWIFAGLQSVSLTLGHIAFLTAPLSIIWAIVGLRLGRAQSKRATAQSIN